MALKTPSGQALGLKEQFGLLWGIACYTPDTEASSVASQQDVLGSLEMRKMHRFVKHGNCHHG